MKKVSAAEFARFCQERAAAKDGYIMGATGQDPKKLSAWWFNQYSGSQYTKAVYWKNHAERVWDCNGLAEGYYQDRTGESINTRARYNYASWCSDKGTGIIPPEKRVPGAAVFWGGSASAITHVAFLARPVKETEPKGDWVLVEARGVMYGVVETRLLSRKPQYWGRMDKYFDYDGAGDESGFLTVTGSSVNVREGPGTNFASVGLVNRGDRLCPAACDGWTAVVFDGAVRWISSQYVKEAEKNGLLDA